MAAGGAAAATGERRRCPIWGLASRRNGVLVRFPCRCRRRSSQAHELKALRLHRQLRRLEIVISVSVVNQKRKRWLR